MNFKQTFDSMKIYGLLLFISIWVTGSTLERHPAEPVAAAEFAFAKTSRETNTVNAFVKYLAKDAIMFRQGEPVDGLTLWTNRTPDSTLLNWWPVIADASASGDLGYTTGPYQFFNKRTDKSPVGNGYYSTIWQKQKDGTWKIKVDLGVRLSEIIGLPTKLSYVPVGKATGKTSVPINDADVNYNKLLNEKSVSFDGTYLSKNYRLHRPVIGPKVNAAAEVTAAEKDTTFQFEFVGGEESSSDDLAYTYGKVIRTEKDGQKKANYLRVWKNEGGVWKIVLDVATEG
jgi:ketosteroid isomerase-like protein